MQKPTRRGTEYALNFRGRTTLLNFCCHSEKRSDEGSGFLARLGKNLIPRFARGDHTDYNGLTKAHEEKLNQR